ncbi:hypothetical protein NC651_024287 [Populus alba x Populus x berolinensis]|nr:hypothetical protein NC651_024287 [Populus alba x Populus x berolinensis]
MGWSLLTNHTFPVFEQINEISIFNGVRDDRPKPGRLRNRYAQKLGHKRGVTVVDATEWVAVSHMNASIKARKEFACVSSLLLWPLRKGAVCEGLDRLFDPIPFSVSQRPLHENGLPFSTLLVFFFHFVFFLSRLVCSVLSVG